MNTCRICNKEIVSNRGFSNHIVRTHKIKLKEYYDAYLKKENDGKCIVCGKETSFSSLFYGYNKYCCNKCIGTAESVKNKKKETSISNYGVNNPMLSSEVKDKLKCSVKEKFGVENVSQSEEIKKKKEETCLSHFGVEHSFQSEEIKKKIKQTNIEKYSVENVSQSEEIKKKKEETCLSHFGVDNTFKSQEIKERILSIHKIKFINKLSNYLNLLDLSLVDSTYINDVHKHTWKCKKCNNEFVQIWQLIQRGYTCPVCNPRQKGDSKPEQEITEFIKTLGSNVIENSRSIIKPKELDVYIPNLKIAIEYDGLYWHSEEMILDPFYHLNKTLECEKQGIRLIHIFEDEWDLKQDIVKSRLEQILNKSHSEKIHARKCKIKEIDSKTKDEFLEKYHIQGKDTSKVRLGAFYNDELVSVMTFSHGSISKGSRNRDPNIWELNRFCTNYSYHIPGIAGKLLSYFKKNYKWKEIFSYADRRWSQGNLYYKLGFELDYITSPNYWYVKGEERIHRFNLRKRPDEPKDISELILRLQEGYSKVWDCGNLKFIMRYERN